MKVLLHDKLSGQRPPLFSKGSEVTENKAFFLRKTAQMLPEKGCFSGF
jgi:hypothetical protein